MKKRIAVQDPATASALVTSYRARSAFKLLEINEQMGSFLDREDVNSVVDLGAAPGGWSQVVAAKLGWWGATDMVLEAVEQSFESYDSLASETEVDLKKRRPKKVKKGKARLRTSIEEEMDHYDPLNIDHLTLSSQRGRGVIIAVDLLPILPIPGVETLQADFLQDSTTELIQKLLTSKDNPHGKADVILSDVAANVSGNRTHDVQSSLEICEAVFQFAKWNLRSAESIGRKKGGVLLYVFFSSSPNFPCRLRSSFAA